jgi:hypothetical protein
MASKLFQKTAELSADAQISRKVGPAGLLALKSSGISSTTTVKADAFFKNNWLKIKSFTKSIPTYFQKPFSMGKILFYSFIFLGLVLLSLYFYKTYFTKKKEGFENSLAQEKAFALANSIKINPLNINEDDNKLVNIQPITFKQTAYLGIQTFDDNLGILEQLRTGSRSFFLQIDYVEKDLGDGFAKPYEPQLVWRNDAGRMTSQNSASLQKVASSLKEYFNNSSIPNYSSPVILLLHFVRLPYSITETEKYKNYLNKVYQSLNTLDSLLVKGYSKASKESDLFGKKFSDFNKQIIIGTNIDTSVMNGKIDLDKYVHFRYYQHDNDAVDITDTQTVNSNALIYSADYLLSLKDTEKFIKQHKTKFVIVKPKNDQVLKKEQVDILLNKLNVNILLHDYFSDTPENAVSIIQLYNSSYKLKSVF